MSLQASAERQSALATIIRGRDASHYAPLTSWLLTLPLVVTFAIGFLYPVSKLVALSFANGAESYLRIGQDPLYVSVLTTTVITAAAVTAFCLVLGYPVAFAMTRLSGKAALITAACVFVPLWTSVLIRSYAWIVLLQRNGIINNALQEAGLSDQPLKLLYTQGAVILGMTHILLPFAILPIYATLRTQPPDFARAAANLGAGPVRTFLLITLPLSLPGVFCRRYPLLRSRTRLLHYPGLDRGAGLHVDGHAHRPADDSSSGLAVRRGAVYHSSVCHSHHRLPVPQGPFAQQRISQCSLTEKSCCKRLPIP